MLLYLIMEQFWIIAKDHEEIRKWAERLEGKPAIIDDPEVGGDNIGLRIDFPGGKDEGLLSEDRNSTRDVTWDRFFEVLDSKNLAFMHTNEERPHNPSMAYKFVNKEAPFEEQI